MSDAPQPIEQSSGKNGVADPVRSYEEEPHGPKSPGTSGHSRLGVLIGFKTALANSGPQRWTAARHRPMSLIWLNLHQPQRPLRAIAA